MPAQPAWLLQLPAIRATIASLPVAALDRAAIERIFGVRRRRAIELLHRFGGYQAGKTFFIDRAALLARLEELEAGGEFRDEQARRRRVTEDIEQARAARRARSIPIPAPQPASAPGGLPEGTKLGPGELRIAFTGTEELLRRLLELAIAIQNDLPRFEEQCKATKKE